MPLNRVLPHAACLHGALRHRSLRLGLGATPGGNATATVVKSLEVTVTGTTVTPAPAQVDLRIGEALDLTVTIDHDDELRAHGFGDVEEGLKAGVPTTVRLVGTESGYFEVETHEPALTLLTVAVR